MTFRGNIILAAAFAFLGGAGLSMTGCWLAVRRIRQDVAAWFRPRARSETTLRKA